MMDFAEIQRQSSVAARKKAVIDVINHNDGDLVTDISISYEVCDGSIDSYVVETHTTLHRKIKELIIEELEKQNEQTASNLKNWVR